MQLSFKQGDVIFKEGDPADGLYFIMSGYVSVYTANKTHRFATFAAGVFFGEMAIFEDIPRSATVYAETDTELLFLAKSAFFDMTEIDYVSSAGLRVMIDIQKACLKDSQGELTLVNVQRRIYETLELAGFVVLFKFFDSVENALSYFE